MKIRVHRVLYLDYEVEAEHYPGMTPEEAREWEKNLGLEEIIEIMAFQHVRHHVVARVVE